MRKQLLFIALVLTAVFLASTNDVDAGYIIDKTTFFPSNNGCYITFSSSLLPLSFSTLYRGTDGYWNFNTTKMKTNIDMTVTVFCSGNWTNYTVSGLGTQQIYNGSKPNRVFLDGILTSEYSGWIYAGGTITVTVATSSVCLYWGPLISSTASVTGSVLYFRSDTHTINTEVGYILRDMQTTGGLAVSGTTVDVGISVSWGFQVYIVGNNGALTDLSGGSPVALLTRTTAGAGIQNASWIIGETWLNLGFDSLMVKVYLKLGTDDWVLKATHLTSLLLEKRINSSTLVFSCYTEYSATAFTTTGTFRFGNSTYNSFIQGIAFQEPSMLDLMLYNMVNGNLVGALLLPYTYLIGSVFYLIVLLFVSVPLYKRYESVNPVLFVMLVFGGSGGVISLLLPVQALSVGWIVMVLAVAGILYKLVRSTGF